MKRVGVLTSGGDCPGLNACIRAIVRTALAYRLQVFGIRRGFKGLMEGEFVPLHASSVSGIINRGGTFLLTARDEKFSAPSGLRKASRMIAKHRLNGLIVLGGTVLSKGRGNSLTKLP